tara:strand:+ start:28 stop:498 length:471 start_codon:yes stop_codon:yes gene_type:complete
VIEERGRVLSAEPGAVWVATIRSSTCGSCQAKAGCGQAMLQKLGSGSSQGFVRALTEQQWQVGDEVLVGVPEDAVVRSALWVYLVPLLGLFGAALSAQWLGWAEPGVIFAAAVGLLFGFALVRWHDRNSQGDLSLQPQVIARAGAPVTGEARPQEG